jgi:hypothetical protein
MTRDKWVKALAALLLGLGAIWFAGWLVDRTEWVEIPVSDGYKGEARRNQWYAVQQLGRQLGVRVVQENNLDRLPPQGATLWLGAYNWDMFTGRHEQLRQWVEQGGHLVIDANMLGNDKLQQWVQISHEDPPKQAEDEESRADDAPAASAPTSEHVDAEDEDSPYPCSVLHEPEGTPAAFENRSSFNICAYSYGFLSSKRPALWRVENKWGPQIIRVRLGVGQITAINNSPWSNHEVLRGDSALLAVAAMGLMPGAEIWWVDEESRQPLIDLLWDRAWVVFALGALALLAAWWRGNPRFGPMQIDRPLARRSMGEQIRGTAAYLKQQGRPALYQAQSRALDEAALRHVRGWGRMQRSERAQALAQATGLPEADLARALDPALRRSSGDFFWTLELLETARRRLGEHTPRASQPPH